MGQVVLAVGLIGESLSILFLTAFDFYSRLGLSFEFFVSAVKFAGIFALAYVLMRAFKFVIWWAPKRVASLIETEDPMELGVRLAVAMLFIFLAAAAFLGVEAILGAFIAGALFGFIFQEREAVADKINAMGQGFVVPFFFIVVGSHFDPMASFKGISGMLFFELLVLAVVVKILPSLIFRAQGLSGREIFASGLLLSAPLTLTVAVSEVGHSLGAINDRVQGVLILVAITAGLVCPLIARLVLPAKEEDEVDKMGEGLKK